MSVKITKDDVAKLLANIDALTTKRVYIGVPGEASSRGESITNASIGYINEFGSPVNNIPPRPHLVPGVKSVEPKIIEDLRKSAKLGLKNPNAIVAGLERAGITGMLAVRKLIVSQEGFKDLDKKTIKARQRDGFKGTKALIRSGQYLNSIQSVVRAK